MTDRATPPTTGGTPPSDTDATPPHTDPERHTLSTGDAGDADRMAATLERSDHSLAPDPPATEPAGVTDVDQDEASGPAPAMPEGGPFTESEPG